MKTVMTDGNMAYCVPGIENVSDFTTPFPWKRYIKGQFDRNMNQSKRRQLRKAAMTKE